MSPSQLNLGGAERVRTDDILNANQVLFQLSYGPLNPSRPAFPLRLPFRVSKDLSDLLKIY